MGLRFNWKSISEREDALSFNDVLLVPKKLEMRSRRDPDLKTKFTKKLARLEDESWSSDVNSNLDALRSQFLQGLSIELTYFNQNMNSNCFQFDYFKVGQLKSLVCKLSQFSKMMNATESFLFTNTYNERYFDLWYLAKNNEEFRHYSVSSLKRFIQFFKR